MSIYATPWKLKHPKEGKGPFWNFDAITGETVKNKKPPPGLAARRRQIGDWEFANLSFPR
jgi:hypothetical protein